MSKKVKSSTKTSTVLDALRLYQTIRFSRPINEERDLIIPGGYRLKVKDDIDRTRLIDIDFSETDWSVDDNDPCVVHYVQKDLDYGFSDHLFAITEHMLRTIIDIIDWYIYVDVTGSAPISVMEVTNAGFEITCKNDTIDNIPLGSIMLGKCRTE